jgi:uncharacterized protein YecE (DUF72 family)
VTPSPRPLLPERGGSSSGLLRVGTSGWAYGGWTRFYPPEVRPPRKLEFYSAHFPTVEVNTSFYHLPLATTYAKWAGETGPDFRFTLKLSRYISHIKRLSGVTVATRRFLERALPLGPKLGPILVQLPPQLRADPKRLRRFLRGASAGAARLGLSPLRLAFEFRHASWFESEASLETLAEYSAAVVFGHSSKYPYPAAEPHTAEWTYLRFHGPRELFASEYGKAGLRPWIAKIARWVQEGSDVYAYFNNDVHGYAVDDARRLLSMARATGTKTARS